MEQEDLDAGTLARSAHDAQLAAALTGETLDHGQTEAGAIPALGGKEWLAGVRQHLGRHTSAGVDDRDHDAPVPQLRSQAQLPALRHRVARVQGKIEQRRFQMRPVDQDIGQTGVELQMDDDVVPDHARQGARQLDQQG